MARNGPERLIFPRLEVARRPVVEQAIAGDMLGRLADRDRRARAHCPRRPRCRARAHNRAAGSAHIRARRRRAPCAGRWGGSPARPRRAPSLPGRDSRSAHIYSWAAADCRAGTACRRWSRDECRRRSRCSRRSGTERAAAPRSGRPAAARHRRGSVSSDSSSMQPRAKRALRFGPARQPAVEHRLRQIVAPILVEQVGDAGEVEHVIADRDARPPPPLADREDAERQVLDRKVAALRALAPAGERRIVAWRSITAASPWESRPTPGRSPAARARAPIASGDRASRSRP